ncbi:sushi repeat-containing protein SRPX isoform X1 [Pangasianodon hypophthalmus]|uniref:sushi repeat-containing protein SRPX isoform X1 n=1 Tax=Pangasianodon hypophthalmus TaxID=310915 RepID=UPI002307F7FF|nr:sushi repeat-containing protein SRPX isoform X1 [Pangasianodon hypophthalmus]
MQRILKQLLHILNMDNWLSVCVLVGLQVACCLAYDGSGYWPYTDDEDVRYTGVPWCAPIKVKHGHVSCQTPRGEHYKNVLGTRCKIHCKRGYELHGSSEILCMASKQWSGKYTCREVRCPTLAMPSNGGFKCSDGSYYNSHCQFFCSPGYILRGDRSVTCQSSRAWSGGQSVCLDLDPPVIKCPNVKEKTAEPGKVTAKVTWDTPEGKDTADGILTDVILKGKPPGTHFTEGNHKQSYTVFDRAGNKATCKFNIRVKVRRCTPLSVPENGWMKCDSAGDNYGATCDFRCLGGYELRGSAARVCQFNMEWSGLETSCAPMNINVGVRSAAQLLDQFYEKRRLLIISTPTAANHYYRFQMTNLQQAQCGLDLRHVTVVELVGRFPAQIGRIRYQLIPPGLALQLRLLLQLSQNSFNLVLLDKQGVDKQRYTYPVTAAEIFSIIDTFPLRTEEALLQKEAGHGC